METTLTSGQLELQLKLFGEKKMTPDRWNRILSSGLLADLCDPSACLDNRDALRAALKLGVALPPEFAILVEYWQSLEQMIARGNYDRKNDDITAKRFPVVGENAVTWEAKLFHFDRDISSEKAVEEMKVAGWEPGKIEHLLSFGYKYPEEQRKYPIIGLGSVALVGGYRYVPCLAVSDRERSLDLDGSGGDWYRYYRFLAVRTLSSAA